MFKEPYYPIAADLEESDRRQPSFITTMRKKFRIFFLVALLILILSEYFFLEEVFGRSNIIILLLTGLGISLSIICIVSLIKREY